MGADIPAAASFASADTQNLPRPKSRLAQLFGLHSLRSAVTANHIWLPRELSKRHDSTSHKGPCHDNCTGLSRPRNASQRQTWRECSLSPARKFAWWPFMVLQPKVSMSSNRHLLCIITTMEDVLQLKQLSTSSWEKSGFKISGIIQKCTTYQSELTRGRRENNHSSHSTRQKQKQKSHTEMCLVNNFQTAS